MIEILSSSALNQVQDLGRRGHMQLGISRGGAMDSLAFTCANLLAGNPMGAPGIEIGLFPFRVRFRQAIRFACTGADAQTRLDGRLLPPWWSAVAKAGQTLVMEPPQRGGRAYLAVAGGIDVPLHLGSASTDNKACFGGLEGRGLRRGDVLAVASPTVAPAAQCEWGCAPTAIAALWRQLDEGLLRLRSLVAAEYALFTPRSQAAFLDQEWMVTREINRTGYRLDGECLELRRPTELLSHGILPGVVQVPPAGRPIVQMAEANTSGGYPKIASVIAADLWQLAQAPTGTRVRFALATLDEAIAAERERRQFLDALRADLSICARSCC